MVKISKIELYAPLAATILSLGGENIIDEEMIQHDLENKEVFVGDHYIYRSLKAKKKEEQFLKERPWLKEQKNKGK
jgi:hypothetical protein